MATLSDGKFNYEVSGQNAMIKGYAITPPPT